MTLVLATSCFAADGRTREQRVCCAAMAHDCGAAAIDRGCCSGEAAKVVGVAPGTLTITVSAPAAVLIALLDEPSPVARLVACAASHSRSLVRTPADPTYLLNSTLRI